MKANGLWQRISTIILAILMVVPFSFIQAKANTYNANYSLTQYNYYVEKNGTDWATTDIFVNFKAPASGTLTINISPNLSSNYYSFVVISGGNLAASPTTSTSKITIGVRSQQNIQVRVQSISTQSNAHATYTMSFSGTYEDGEALSLENIEAELVTLNGKIDTTNNVLSQINTKLSNLSIQDYTQILNTINTSIGSIQTAIEALPDYTNVLNNINTFLGSIDTNVSDIETICSGIQTSINSILSTLQNIDNLIDTISWLNSNFTFLGYTTDGSSYSQTQGRVTNGTYSFTLRATGMNGCMLKLSLNVYPYSFNLNEIEIKTAGGIDLKPHLSYYQYSRLGIYLYFDMNHITNNFWSDQQINIKIPDSYFYTSTVVTPNRIQYMTSNDIEYWKLLSTFQQYNFYHGNAETNQAISDQQSINQSFESQSNQYHNLESTFQSNFDTAFNAVNPSDFTTALTQFAPAFAWFTNQLGALYDSSGNFKILFTLPLILGLAMFFLGRGGKVFDHPEHESDKHAYTFSKDNDGTIYPVRKNRSGNNVRNS